MNTPVRIVHISTVHRAIDPRIRLKQLRSIARYGAKADLVTTDPDARERDDGVILHRIEGDRTNRIRRMFVLAPRAILRALLVRASAYHLHDPELAPWAWVLLLRGVPVVYDVHEDFARFMRHKPYIPARVGVIIGGAVGLLERLLTAFYRTVIAEHCYRQRFPRSVAILNYPSRSLLQSAVLRVPRSPKLLYTGNATVARGALHLARLVQAARDVDVTLVGECAPHIARRMRETAADAANRLHIVGLGRYVSFDEIAVHYARPEWLAGIVLMPDSPHYREKQLTKLFEYMAVGLPVIASDFPVWRALIVDQGVGFCVDPDDPAAALVAVEQLRSNPELVRQMSARGQELVRKRYNWERQEDRLMAVYEKRRSRA